MALHRWHQLVLLGIMLVLGVGLGIGALLMLQHVGSQVRFYGLMALVAALAALLILAAIVVAIVKWLWRSRGAGVVGRLREAVSSLLAKPPGALWPDHLALTWQAHGPILWSAVLTTFAFIAGLALLHPVVLGLFSFASYLSSQAQVEVTLSQNVILAIDQQFQEKSALAEQRFTQISTVLLDAEASPELQRFALSEIIDAMLVPVPRVDRQAAESNLPRVVYSFPNLARLRNVLRQFMRTDRVGPALAKVGKKLEPSQPAPEETAAILQALGPLSDELLHTLHRLGPADPFDPEGKRDLSLWRWDPDANGVPEDQLASVPKPREPLPLRVAVQNGMKEPWLVLRHFRAPELAGLCIPHACAQSERWPIDLTGMNLDGANLMSANLRRAQLSGTSFVRARMAGIDLTEARMAGADLEGASLLGASFASAELPGANLSGATLQSGNLSNACLVGADMSYASLQYASLDGSVFDGANMAGVQMLGGSNVSAASFFAVKFDDAALRLTHFDNCRFQGASFRDALLMGSTFTDCELHGIDIAGAWLHGGPCRFGDSSPQKFTFDFGMALFVPDGEDVGDYPTVTLPGVLMAGCTHEPEVRLAFLVGLRGSEVKALVELKPQLATLFDKLDASWQAGTNWREWLPWLTGEAIARLPLPLDLEELDLSVDIAALLEDAFGAEHVDVRSLSTLVLPEFGLNFAPDSPEVIQSPPMLDSNAFSALTAAIESPAQNEAIETQRIANPDERRKEIKTLLQRAAVYPGKADLPTSQWERKLAEREAWMETGFAEALKTEARRLQKPPPTTPPPSRDSTGPKK